MGEDQQNQSQEETVSDGNDTPKESSTDKSQSRPAVSSEESSLVHWPENTFDPATLDS